MIVIGNRVFVIIPSDDPCAAAMRKTENGGDKDHVELAYWDTKTVILKQPPDFKKLSLENRLACRTTRTSWWRAGFILAEAMYGESRWVCPD